MSFVKTTNLINLSGIDRLDNSSNVSKTNSGLSYYSLSVLYVGLKVVWMKETWTEGFMGLLAYRARSLCHEAGQPVLVEAPVHCTLKAYVVS